MSPPQTPRRPDRRGRWKPPRLDGLRRRPPRRGRARARRLCPKRLYICGCSSLCFWRRGLCLRLCRFRRLKAAPCAKALWYKINPAARALIDAAILYLRRGGRIKSPALAEALRKAAEEVLRLTTPIRVLAKAVGYAVARQLGVEVDEERAVALGIQWLNTPKRWRKDVTTP
jgi:hypothetical protein